jgi:hypothetical protein
MIGHMKVPQYEMFKQSGQSNHDFFDSLSNNDLMMKNSDFLNRKNIIIDNQEALEFEYINYNNPLGSIFESHIIGIMTIVGDDVIEAKFIVEGLQENVDISAQYSKYYELFRMVFDSFKFNI